MPHEPANWHAPLGSRRALALCVLTVCGVAWATHATGSGRKAAVRLQQAIPALQQQAWGGRTLPPAFDQAGARIFMDRLNVLLDDVFNLNKTMDVQVPGATFKVVGAPPSFWDNVVSQSWEPHTYRRYFQYITPSTTLVDFGTWIGPTLLYGAARAGRVFGVEGDPAAYAEALVNVQLNADRLRNVHLQPGCVSLKREDRTMHSADVGGSCSGLGTKLCGEATTAWSVRCYDLPALFKRWGVALGLDTFVKVDVEGYECDLVPGLVDWLLAAPLKPTIQLAMHGELQPCSASQYGTIARLARAYAYAECHQGGQAVSLHQHPMPADLDVGALCPSGEMLLSDLVPSAAVAGG